MASIQIPFVKAIEQKKTDRGHGIRQRTLKYNERGVNVRLMSVADDGDGCTPVHYR
jgi:hypothetical protein